MEGPSHSLAEWVLGFSRVSCGPTILWEGEVFPRCQVESLSAQGSSGLG